MNGEAVQVFEYPKSLAADAEGKLVSSDGDSIGTSKPTWIAKPPFFKSGKLIGLYLGENQSILNLLRGAFGNQFAGG